MINLSFITMHLNSTNTPHCAVELLSMKNWLPKWSASSPPTPRNTWLAFHQCAPHQWGKSTFNSPETCLLTLSSAWRLKQTVFRTRTFEYPKLPTHFVHGLAILTHSKFILIIFLFLFKKEEAFPLHLMKVFLSSSSIPFYLLLSLSISLSLYLPYHLSLSLSLAFSLYLPICIFIHFNLLHRYITAPFHPLLPLLLHIRPLPPPTLISTLTQRLSNPLLREHRRHWGVSQLQRRWEIGGAGGHWKRHKRSSERVQRFPRAREMPCTVCSFCWCCYFDFGRKRETEKTLVPNSSEHPAATEPKTD